MVSAGSLEPKIRKCWKRVFIGTRIDLLAILKKKPSLNEVCLHFEKFRIYIDVLTPLNRTSHIKMYKIIARPRLLRRIAKKSIPYSILAHDLLAIEFKSIAIFISEIEFRFQC